MADVTEVMSDQLSSEDVARRVEDWVARIEALYGQVIGWLPPEWRAERSRSREMHEELMREFGVRARRLTILDLLGPEGARATIEPRGLWIIGANGRLDLTSDKDHFIILDRASSFQPPDWGIAPLTQRQQLSKLTQRSLLDALSA